MNPSILLQGFHVEVPGESVSAESGLQQAVQGGGIHRTGYSAQELLATDFPEPRYALPGVLAEGLNFLAGAPKLGKSWWALNVSLAVAFGRQALGKIPVEQGEVLYLALEDPPRRLKERLKAVLGERPPPDGLFFETQWPKVDDDGIEKLEGWLAGHPCCRLVVIDVFARLRARGSERAERYATDYAAAEPLKKLGDTYRVAVLALHHTRKAGADDFLETVSGTFGLAGAADTVIVLKRSRGRAEAELHVTGRDVVEQQLALRFAPENGTWELMGDAAEWALSETRHEILAALRTFGSLPPKALSKKTAIPYETVKKTLQRMSADGQVFSNDGRYSVIDRSLQSSVPSVPVVPRVGT